MRERTYQSAWHTYIFSFSKIAFIFNNIFSKYKIKSLVQKQFKNIVRHKKSNLKVLTIPLPGITYLNTLEVCFQQCFNKIVFKLYITVQANSENNIYLWYQSMLLGRNLPIKIPLMMAQHFNISWCISQAPFCQGSKTFLNSI